MEEVKTAGTATEAGQNENAQRAQIVELGKPYKFEGKEYTEIDLSGLNNLTIKDAINAQIELFGQQEVASSLVCETTTSFAIAIAAKATGFPIEFFKIMPRSAGVRVRRAIVSYLSSRNASKNDGAALHLEKPYLFRGTVYTELDLSGIAELSTMAESAAENEMAREGIVITENSFNYLYVCIIAAMATKQPKEFFTGLPLYELLKLKNAVNNANFFE